MKAIYLDAYEIYHAYDANVYSHLVYLDMHGKDDDFSYILSHGQQDASHMIREETTTKLFPM